ncbi:MAG: hypothetical protein GY851_26520, partial [bacterium]|nr:hypothetical protein [bacterium]
GANKFYNHGYTCTPDRDIAPSRRFFAEMLISHSNVWWPHYRHLSDYVARSSYLLRQGSFVADVAVYSPLASQWTHDVRNARRWTRDFDWGGLGRMLLANGYDFDLMNDDVLQNHASLDDGVIRVRDLTYRVLLLPNIEALPLETLERIKEFVQDGGVAIALERAPRCSTGFHDHAAKDEAVRVLSEAMFGTPVWRHNPTAPRDYGKGKTYHIRHVLDDSDVLENAASALHPFLNTLRAHVPPDFGIDFVGENLRENDGLAYLHRRTQDLDIYFVTNIQDRAIDMSVAFRIERGTPSEWNPYDGGVNSLWEYQRKDGATWVPLRLAPHESTFIVFETGRKRPHVVASTFRKVLEVDDTGITATVAQNGSHHARSADGAHARTDTEAIPAPYTVSGEWRLTLNGRDFPSFETTLTRLASWTEDPRTKHFSGTGVYEIDFELPAAYFVEGLELALDLSVVGAIAEVELNDKPIGTRWMRGQLIELEGAARPGANP